MRKVIFYFSLAICLLSTIATGSPNKIVFIYSTDSSSADAYKSLLEPAGFTTDLVLSSNNGTTDFSKYYLIIIGNDVSTLSGSDINKISDSAKPIIGLGEGGYSFFGGLGLKTGYPNGWHGSKNSIYTVDKTQTVFNKPNSITIPTDNILQLYSSTGHVGIYLPSVPSNVIVLGRESTDTTHYPFTLENSKYLLWGFTASPTSMTQTGKDLFVNSVNYFLPSNGRIQIRINNKNATFTLSGPATYSGSGSSWNQSNLPLGTYTIIYGSVSGYHTPPSETKILSDGGTIYFFGDYLPIKRADDSVDLGDGYIFLIKDVNSAIGNVRIELQLDNRIIGNKTLKKTESYVFYKYNCPEGYCGKKVMDISHDTIGDYVVLKELPIPPPPTTGPHAKLKLNIESVPQSADIFIDNEYVGKTNKTINILDIKQHFLRLELSGYEKTEETFKFEELKKGETILKILNKTQPTVDVNSDGSITGIDAMWIAQYVVGKRVGLDVNVADVNGDGSITGIDAMWIAQYVVGKRIW